MIRRELVDGGPGVTALESYVSIYRDYIIRASPSLKLGLVGQRLSPEWPLSHMSISPHKPWDWTQWDTHPNSRATRTEHRCDFTNRLGARSRGTRTTPIKLKAGIIPARISVSENKHFKVRAQRI